MNKPNKLTSDLLVESDLMRKRHQKHWDDGTSSPEEIQIREEYMAEQKRLRAQYGLTTKNNTEIKRQKEELRIKRREEKEEEIRKRKEAKIKRREEKARIKKEYREEKAKKKRERLFQIKIVRERRIQFQMRNKIFTKQKVRVQNRINNCIRKLAKINIDQAKLRKDWGIK
jgi:chromatin assembly factor 1 subunit A